MATLTTVRVTEGSALVISQPTAQSMVIDNYSRHTYIVQEAGVYIAPYNGRIVSLPSPLSSVTLTWQNPPGAAITPIGVPPGYAICVFSSNTANTSLGLPLLTSQTTSILLFTAAYNSPSTGTFSIPIPTGTQAILCVPRGSSAGTTDDWVATVEIYGAPSHSQYATNLPISSSPLTTVQISPGDTQLYLEAGGLAPGGTILVDFFGVPNATNIPLPIINNQLQPLYVTSSTSIVATTSTLHGFSYTNGATVVALAQVANRFLRGFTASWAMVNPTATAEATLMLKGATSGTVMPLDSVAVGNAIAGYCPHVKDLGNRPIDLLACFPNDLVVNVILTCGTGVAVGLEMEATPN